MRFLLPALMIILLSALPLLAQDEPAPAAPVTIPLKDLQQPGARIFGVPVECNGVHVVFAWNCLSTSRISESCARHCGLSIVHIAALDRKVDAQGRKFFAGEAIADITLAGQTQQMTLIVMRDEMCQEIEKTGLIGFDIARTVQWTLDPDAPALTIAPLGTQPTTQPIATIPIRTDADSYLLTVKVRNEPLPVRLLPAATFIQADPLLQHKWDLSSKTKLPTLFERFGDIGYVELHGKDTVELGGGLSDTDLVVLLVGDAKHAPTGPLPAGGIGAELLNRYIVTVDSRLKCMYVLSKAIVGTTTQPAPATDASK